MKYLLLLLLGISISQTSNAQNSENQCKCCTDEHQQFSFWEGDWNTFTPDGKLAGTNKIVWLQDSCILQENWTSARGLYTGTSYNYYDASTNEWHQTWVDNQGGSLQLKGEWTGKSMVLKSETLQNQKGENYRNRITWTPNEDGTVRQLWEVSSDNETTWKAVFDGLYQLKTE